MAAKGRSGLRVNGRLEIPARELVLEFARSGGPGGQNVNKVETKVILRFDVARSQALGAWRRERLLQRLAGRLNQKGQLVIHASRYRERARNEADARERLAALLREALRVPKVRRGTRPTKGSVERRLAEKRRRAETKRRRGDRGRGENEA